MDDTVGVLTDEQATNPHGCGAGTPNACHALVKNSLFGPYRCAWLANTDVANMAGIQLSWRVNVDPEDNKAWCPLGVLKNSKTA